MDFKEGFGVIRDGLNALLSDNVGHNKKRLSTRRAFIKSFIFIDMSAFGVK